MSNVENEIIVVKFGGSVLENEKSIDQAANLVRETRDRGLSMVVVVSAMKGVTDQLLALSKKVNPQMDAALMDEVLSSGEKTSALSTLMTWSQSIPLRLEWPVCSW